MPLVSVSITVIVSMLAGIVMGVLAYRHLQNYLSTMDVVLCAHCGKEGHGNLCYRCNKHVGVCHSYALLLPHPGGPGLRPRPSRHVCTACATPSETEAFKQEKVSS